MLQVEYIKNNIFSNDDNIQKLSVIIGRLENRAIGKLIEKIGIITILEEYLSKKDLDKYFKSKYKLKTLLNQ